MNDSGQGRRLDYIDARNSRPGNCSSVFIKATLNLHCDVIMTAMMRVQPCVGCQSVPTIHLKLPERMEAISGDPVTLPATYSTDRRVMNIAWYKLDPREPTSRTQIFSYYPPLQTRESYGDYVGRTSLEDQASLRIARTKPADEGKYILSVSVEGVGSSEGQVQLILMDPPSILSISDSLSATVADSVSVQCVADGNPPPNITWSRDGTRLRSAVHSVTSDMRTSTVKLGNVRVNDSGKYVCQASNGVGRGASSSLVLTIRESRLGVTSSTVAVVVGASAGGLWFIVCVALAAYLVKRRRLQDEKKKFAFYYNMGRREPTERGELGEDKEPPPYTATPGKPSNKAPNYGGINTIRKSIGRKERRYARAVYSYRPREENELRLEMDDVIEVLEGEDGGWCLGYLRGRIGLFPSNYVRFISSSEGYI
uniref:Ig-like domain-containing protein n=1 Tax=Branchiostoma floridae TaxID=7739 RepID=C3ZIG5_BRAFL|eukprot:XP_002591679.1 hypothetical protein BRAFLDRAFT_80767 [Branchiostoma floridae]